MTEKLNFRKDPHLRLGRKSPMEIIMGKRIRPKMHQSSEYTLEKK